MIKHLLFFVAGFFISRCLSGIAVVSFKSAKSDGLLFMFADTAHRTIVRAALYIQLALCIAVLLIVSLPYAVVMIIAAALSFWYYYVEKQKRSLAASQAIRQGILCVYVSAPWQWLWVVSLLLFSIFVLNIGMVRIRILIKVVL